MNENPFPKINISLTEIALYALDFGFDCYDWVADKFHRSNNRGVNIHPKVLDVSEFMQEFDKAMEDAVEADLLEQRWQREYSLRESEEEVTRERMAAESDVEEWQSQKEV